MSLRDKPVEAIAEADILELIAHQVRTGRFIEYRRRLPRGPERQVDFLAVISSLANSGGGDLVVGVDETGSQPLRVCGLGPELDANEQREYLDHLIEDGIEPGIEPPTIQFVSLSDPAQRGVFVIRVARSWRAPHMVKLGGEWKYYARNSVGSYAMDAFELRRAFMEPLEIEERIKRFRADRVALIKAGQTPVRLAENPKVVLHVAPFSIADATTRVDLAVAERRGGLEPLYATGHSHRYNLDGHLSFSATENGVAGSYVQLFRDGAIEAVDAAMISPRVFPNGVRLLVPSGTVEQEIISAVAGYIDFLKELRHTPPFAVMLSLLGVEGYRMEGARPAVAAGPLAGLQHGFDRSVLLLPELVLQDYPERVDVALRSLLDTVWNADGWERSPNFDAEGNWEPA